MIEIREALHADVTTIGELADAIWWPTYGGFLPKEQIVLMLENMYSKESLEEQMRSGVVFLVALHESEEVGFASFSKDNDTDLVKLHKLYILPRLHGLGVGRRLIDEVSNRSRKLGGQILEVNVNRNNSALNFYQKLGFKIVREVDIPYHQFTLNDYVLQMAL